jgi:hypothetical protein
MKESLKVSFDLPTMSDTEGDLPIELSVAFDPQTAGLELSDGSVTLDMNLFYASAAQDAVSEYSISATATLKDAMSMESTYSFSILIAPKGEYVAPAAANKAEEEVIEEKSNDSSTSNKDSSSGSAKNTPGAGFDPTVFESLIL